MKISLFERSNKATWRFEISLAGDPVVFYGATIRRCDSFFQTDVSEKKNNWSFATFLPRRLAVLKPPGLK